MGLWTVEDRDRIKAAVLELATGARVVTVNYSGPPSRSVTYHTADLPQLRSLLAEAEADVASASGGRTVVRYASLKKGF